MNELDKVKKLMFGTSSNKNTIKEEVDTYSDLRGNKYRIIPEGTKYYIKKNKPNTNGLLNEDYNYIGGLEKKTKECYSSIAVASKRLNTIINSINETVNVPKNNKDIFKETKQLISESENKIIDTVEDFVINEVLEVNDNLPFDNLTLTECINLMSDLKQNNLIKESNILKSLLKQLNVKNLNEQLSAVQLHYINKVLSEQNLISYDNLLMEEYIDLLDETKVKIDLDKLTDDNKDETPESFSDFDDNENTETDEDNLEFDGGDEETETSESPFDEEPFDAGVEADEETEPKKYLEQLTGKIGQSLREYNSKQESVDTGLQKYIINSVISALDLKDFDESDIEDIVTKLKENKTEDTPKEDGISDEGGYGKGTTESPEIEDVSTDVPLDESLKKFEFYGYKGRKDKETDFSVNGQPVSLNEIKKSIKVTYKSNITGDLNIDGFVIAENKEKALSLLQENKHRLV